MLASPIRFVDVDLQIGIWFTGQDTPGPLSPTRSAPLVEFVFGLKRLSNRPRKPELNARGSSKRFSLRPDCLPPAADLPLSNL